MTRITEVSESVFKLRESFAYISYSKAKPSSLFEPNKFWKNTAQALTVNFLKHTWYFYERERHIIMSNLGTLRNINPRVTWKHEDENFTPWLSENLILLDNALNMNLELVEEQVEVGRYKCDLLCRDTKNGEFVVIENQLDAFNHDHLGKALVYTAGLDTKTVIWIAEDFTNEH